MLRGIKEYSKIKIKTVDGEVFEGVVMPKTKYNREDSIIIKLKSGYNMAFRLKDISKIERKGDLKNKILKQVSHKKEEKNLKYKVLLLSTGGTIASKVEYETGGVIASLDPQDLINLFPTWYKNDVRIIAKVIMQEMSENLTPKDWNYMITKVIEEYQRCQEVDGIIIGHGTDTMHYSSAALSFKLSSLIPVPIVLVGSQRSSDRPSADSIFNIIAALEFIKAYSGKGVFVCMHGGTSDEIFHVHYGTRVRKMHTSRRDAFKSINFKPKSVIRIDLEKKKIEIKFDERDYKENDKYKEKIKISCYSSDVALIKYYPGMKAEDLEYFLKNKKGVIIEGTGLGHINVRESEGLLEIIKKYSSEKFIGMTSQTIYGSVHPYVYKNLRLIKEAGVVFLKDMVPEVAYVKLSLAVNMFKTKEEIEKFMLTPIFFEIDERESYW